MDMFDFKPTTDETRIEVPFYEDARADYAPYYSSGKSADQAKAEVGTELAKLGVDGFFFQEGAFGNDPKRYGYQVTFFIGGIKGLIRVAGLPIQSETAKKIASVRVQALLVLRDQLKAAVTARVFTPLAHPLVGYLLIDGEQTVNEVVARQHRLPQIDIQDVNRDGVAIMLPSGE